MWRLLTYGVFRICSRLVGLVAVPAQSPQRGFRCQSASDHVLQRTINAPDDFSFGAAEKEATIRELREEVRIVRSRMENNPEVKRYAGVRLELLARLRPQPRADISAVLLANHLHPAIP